MPKGDDENWPELDPIKIDMPATRWELFDLISEQSVINLVIIRKIVELREALKLPDDSDLMNLWNRQGDLYEKSRSLVTEGAEQDV